MLRPNESPAIRTRTKVDAAGKRTGIIVPEVEGARLACWSSRTSGFTAQGNRIMLQIAIGGMRTQVGCVKPRIPERSHPHFWASRWALTI
jgi:hypothetical protein